MVNNAELKSCLQTLAQSTLSLYYKYLPPDKLKEYGEQIRAFKLMGLDAKVTENPMFAECIGLMEKDGHIKALNGKLVGTYNSSTIIQDNTFTILSFLRQLYIKNPTYEQDIFNQAYSSLEELFYSDVLRVRDISRLSNFHYDSSLIELGHGINIKKDPIPRVTYTSSEGMRRWTYVEWHVSDFTIERLYEREKVISDTKGDFKPKKGDSEQGLPKTVELFDFVISALRILKSSAVFRDAELSEVLTFHPIPSISGTRSLSETIVQGEKCVIEEKDVPELKRIFNFLIVEKDSRFNVAQRRLFLGMERNNLEDRLIDYMIGLEALYLPDGNQELSFRLSLRMAFLLYTKPKDRKEAFKFVKGMYDTRSKIVHGKKYNLTKDEIDKLEELLRKSLKLRLNDKKNFLADKLSNSGKLISEGTLSNIFFHI